MRLARITLALVTCFALVTALPVDGHWKDMLTENEQRQYDQSINKLGHRIVDHEDRLLATGIDDPNKSALAGSIRKTIGKMKKNIIGLSIDQPRNKVPLDWPADNASDPTSHHEAQAAKHRNAIKEKKDKIKEVHLLAKGKLVHDRVRAHVTEGDLQAQIHYHRHHLDMHTTRIPTKRKLSDSSEGSVTGSGKKRKSGNEKEQ